MHADAAVDVVTAPANPTLAHSMSSSSEPSDIGRALHEETPENSLPNPRKGFSFSDWRWEIASWVVGTFALFVLLILLSIFKTRSLSSWNSKVSINAMVSVLDQSAQSALAVSLASCLAQLKWDWLRTRMNMSNIEILDEACQGPLGCMFLVWERPSSSRSVSIPASLAKLASTNMQEDISLSSEHSRRASWSLLPHSVNKTYQLTYAS
jgi:hypothetical protein